MSGSEGVARISKERARQVFEEHWDAAHDEEHDRGQLALAAASYAIFSTARFTAKTATRFWPWGRRLWKPGVSRYTDLELEQRIRCLEKAGALIAAEIDRLIAVYKARAAD